MKKIKIYSRIAGIMNLLYAIALTALMVFAVIAVVATLNGVGESEGLEGLGTAIGAIIITAVGFIAVLIALVPCVLLWVSSIGLIRTGKKVKKRPAAYAILSIVVHSIILAGGLIGVVALFFEGQITPAALIGGALVISVVNIILCASIKSKFRLLPKDVPPEEPVV